MVLTSLTFQPSSPRIDIRKESSFTTGMNVENLNRSMLTLPVVTARGQTAIQSLVKVKPTMLVRVRLLLLKNRIIRRNSHSEMVGATTRNHDRRMLPNTLRLLNTITLLRQRHILHLPQTNIMYLIIPCKLHHLRDRTTSEFTIIPPSP
jgi:hypothetical protein